MSLKTLDFQVDDGRLTVYLDSDRLHLESIQSKDIDDCVKLFGSRDVMDKYADRQQRSRESVEKRINESWLKRWKQNDPFSALSVFKADEDCYLGFVVAGYGDMPGQSEMAYLFFKNFWNKGYGSEAVGAMIYGFAPETIKRGYLLEGKPLSQITATVSEDNVASVKILEKVGMTILEKREKYGIPKYIYQISSDQFMKF